MSRYLKNNTSNTKKVRDHPPVVFESSKVDFEITGLRKIHTNFGVINLFERFSVICGFLFICNLLEDYC